MALVGPRGGREFGQGPGEVEPQGGSGQFVFGGWGVGVGEVAGEEGCHLGEGGGFGAVASAGDEGGRVQGGSGGGVRDDVGGQDAHRAGGRYYQGFLVEVGFVAGTARSEEEVVAEGEGPVGDAAGDLLDL